MRRADARRSSALLIDQDRRIIAADRLAQCRDQVADLRRLATIAAEEDEAKRISGAKKAVFFWAQLFPGAAQNDRARRFPWCTAHLTGQRCTRRCAASARRRSARPPPGPRPVPSGCGSRSPSRPDRRGLASPKACREG